MKIPSLTSVGRKELLSLWGIIWIISIGLLYIFTTLFILNYRLVLDIFTGSFPLRDSIGILSGLLGGLFTAFSPLDSIIIILSALLVGVNIFLIARTIYSLEHSGRIRLSVGGATIIGIVSAGCSSCGFSILSILGLSTSLSFLPFHGMELHILSLGFLIFSALYMLMKLRNSAYCKL